MYKKMLEDLRKEVEAPVEPVMPANRKGLVAQRQEEAPPEETSPLSLMKEWHNRIKASSSKFKQQTAEKKLSKPSAVAAPLPVEEAPKDKSLVKRPSAFSGDMSLARGGDDFGDFSLDINDAASLIRDKEGFRNTPYWDVNAYRVGYGSDTVTKPDGTIMRVTPNISVSREDAERDLERRIGEFASKAANKVGESNWNALPSKAQAALTSIAYNYGHLPSNVAEAARTGSLAELANSVDSLKSHNEGINRKRRAHEAALIRSSGV